MVTYRASVSVQSVDIGQLPPVAFAVLDQFRRIKFDRGAAVHPTTGARIEGLANLSNSHPRVGSEYVIVTEREVLPDMNDDELTTFLALDQSEPTAFAKENDAFFQKRRDRAAAAGTIRTVHDVSNARLTDDDRKQVAVEVSTSGETSVKVDVRLEPPQRPTHANVEGVATIPGHWFVSGDLDFDGHIDIDALCSPRAASASSAEMTARHRRGRCSITVEVTDSGLGSWTIDGTLRARGAGWFRPIAAIAGAVTRSRFQRKLDAWLESGAFDDGMNELRADITRIADSSPEAIATELVDDLLAVVVETLPPTPLR